MKKINYLLCLVMVLGIITGCSSKNPETVVKEGIDNNNGTEISELYSKNDAKEIDKLIINNLKKKQKEISNMSLEEFKKTSYGKILDSEHFEIESQEFIDKYYGLCNLENEKQSEDVTTAISDFNSPVFLRFLYNDGLKKEKDKDYTNAYSIFSSIVNSTDVADDDVLIPEAKKKLENLESKIIGDLNVTIEMGGPIETGNLFTKYFLPVKATNNSGRDIKKITGYYVAFDAQGYPLPVGSTGEYSGYFTIDDNILKNGETRIENAYPEVGDIVSCEFLITEIEYLNGGDYAMDFDVKEAILENWQKVVIN